MPKKRTPLKMPHDKGKTAPQAQSGRTKNNSALYQTQRWRRYRKAYLLEHPLCIECAKKDEVKGADVLDHIKPIRLGGLQYDKANIQPLCNSCHNSKSGRERHNKGYGGTITKD